MPPRRISAADSFSAVDAADGFIQRESFRRGHQQDFSLLCAERFFYRPTVGCHFSRKLVGAGLLRDRQSAAPAGRRGWKRLQGNSKSAENGRAAQRAAACGRKARYQRQCDRARRFPAYHEGEQPGDLRHAGQRGIQQRSNLFAIEKRAVLDNVENALSIAFKKFLEFAVHYRSARAETLPFTPASRCGPALSLNFQHVGQRMCRIGGHEQRRLARMARRQMQRQRAGDGRLPYSALPHDKCQLGHRVESSGKTRRAKFRRSEKRDQYADKPYLSLAK